MMHTRVTRWRPLKGPLSTRANHRPAAKRSQGVSAWEEQARDSAGSRANATSAFALPLSSKPVNSTQHSSRLLTGELKMFLNSADLRVWDHWARRGIFNGFTVNPRILLQDGVRCDTKSLTTLAQHAFEVGASEMQIQAWGSCPQDLVSRSLDIAGIDPSRVVVQLLCTDAGVIAANLLRDNGIRVNMTGCCQTHQVMTALGLSTEYATPSLLEMASSPGLQGDSLGQGSDSEITPEVESVLEMHEIVKSQNSRMRIMVSDIQSISQLCFLARSSCNTFSIDPVMAEQLLISTQADALQEASVLSARSTWDL